MLNSTGAHLYRCQLMLSSPVDLPFFVNLTPFLSPSKVTAACKQSFELCSNCNSFMFVVFHNFT